MLVAGFTTARFSVLFSNDATWFRHLARHAPASDWIASHFIHALIRAGPFDPLVVTAGPPAGSGERECAPWPSVG